MNLYTLGIAILAIWIIIIILDKKGILEKINLSVEGPFFLAWKTKKIRQLIYSLADRWKNFLNKLGVFNVLVAVGAIIVVTVFLAYQLILTLTMPEIIEEVQIADAILLPGLALPIEYGLVALVFAVVLHEFSHAVYARLESIDVESVGFGILAILPLAFVEPDEEDIENSSKMSKIKMFSGGPAVNIYSFFISIIIVILMVSFIFTPVSSGLGITNVVDDSPADQFGITEDMIITEMDGENIESSADFVRKMSEFSPGEDILITVYHNGKYENFEITIGEMDGSAYLGIEFFDVEGFYSGYKNPATYIAPQTGMWLPTFDSPFYTASLDASISLPIMQTFFWIGLLSFWLGILNMMPIFPLDGGRVFWELVDSLVKKSGFTENTKKYTKIIVGVISIIFLSVYIFPVLLLLI